MDRRYGAAQAQFDQSGRRVSVVLSPAAAVSASSIRSKMASIASAQHSTPAMKPEGPSELRSNVRNVAHPWRPRPTSSSISPAGSAPASRSLDLRPLRPLAGLKPLQHAARRLSRLAWGIDGALGLVAGRFG